MLETRITALVSKLGEKINSLFTWKAGRDEENTFTEDNEFVKPLKVADPVDDAHAVNKGWVEDRVKFAILTMNSITGAYNGFAEFNDITYNDLDINLIDNDSSIEIQEDGYYEVNVSILTNFGPKENTIIDLMLNGTTHAFRITSDGSPSKVGGVTLNTGVIQLNEGDYLKINLTTKYTISGLRVSIKKIK